MKTTWDLEAVAKQVCPDLLRADILRHLETLGLALPVDNCTDDVETILSKENIRHAHCYQRGTYLRREAHSLGRKWPRLLNHFADGCEVEPSTIDPVLVPVESETETGDLFRFATTLWSVPVSRGFGRRMRYLVRDQRNGKLIGIFALGDPVFNLKARDEWIGWNVRDREQRLVNVMDAYIVGAVPPYAQLLGGKLVAALIGSAEVRQAFSARYGKSKGIISKERKKAQLILITVTSALGPSSLYNRLHLRACPNPFDPQSPTLVKLESIGTTQGFGHFHLSDELFERLRRLLAQEDHSYANGHQFGDGPNWRMRVMRVGLLRLGLSPHLVRHGISRKVYAMPLTNNFAGILRGEAAISSSDQPSVKAIAEAALKRWVIPRATRYPLYSTLEKEDYFREQLALLQGLAS